MALAFNIAKFKLWTVLQKKKIKLKMLHYIDTSL